MYATTANLADAKLTRELAQVATPESAPVIADYLMEAVLRGDDTSGFDPSDVAIAEDALATIERSLADATEIIDGYLRMRKPTAYTVPLDPVPGIVAVWCRWIARYLLHKDRVGTEDRTDPIVRDYNEALKFLDQVAAGKFSLGGDDPLPPAAAGAPEVAAPDRQFTADTLYDYGT